MVTSLGQARENLLSMSTNAMQAWRWAMVAAAAMLPLFLRAL